MLFSTVKMAWESVLSGKLRSFLTMLGIIIGVLALVVMVSLVNGATGAVTKEIEDLGNDMVSVTVTDSKGAPLKLKDLETLKSDSRVKNVSPSGSSRAVLKRGSTDTNVSVYSVAAAYEKIQGLSLASGRFIRTVDVENSSYVAVLSHTAAEKLFGETDPLLKSVTLNGRSFLVVGVLEEEENMLTAMMGGSAVYIPFTAGTRLFGSSEVTSFALSAADSVDEAQTAAEEFLLARFKQDEDAFTLVNMSNVSEAMDTVTGYLSILLGSIAAISLLVGGIGIMNIMLVSVTERTKEIGVRKAIGAGRGTILLQFLLESVLLSLMGCGLGLLSSYLLLQLFTKIAETITFTMSADVVWLAVAFSSAIGLLFGLYPANKAASKPPIEALRYEG